MSLYIEVVTKASNQNDADSGKQDPFSVDSKEDPLDHDETNLPGEKINVHILPEATACAFCKMTPVDRFRLRWGSTMGLPDTEMGHDTDL